MDAKERVISGFICFNLSRQSAEALFSDIIEAVKDEIYPKDQTFQEFFGLDEKPPQLIQGYTAEQWQEIIDGGYLCEYSQNGIHWSKAKWPLEKFHELKGGLFEGDMEKRSFCRPAQIKGVMRPIFVEPGDKDAHCIFINDIDGAISGCQRWNSFVKILTNGKWGSIVKYIEL